MRHASLLALGGIVVGLLASAPARAQVFHDDDDGWCLWCFHRYGGDVNRPGATPDRPYWHGDDAVPAGMRWHDLAAARAEAAAADAAAAAAIRDTLSEPPPIAPLQRRRVHRVHRIPPRVPVLVRKD